MRNAHWLLALGLVACSRRGDQRQANNPQGYYGPAQAGPSGVMCPAGMIPYYNQCVFAVSPPAPQPVQVAPQLPSLVHVTFNGVLIAPTKNGGCQWDGLTCNAGSGAKIASAVRLAMRRSNPYIAVVAIFADPLSSAVEKPDIAGVAELLSRGQYSPKKLPKRQDSFTPEWNVRWERVPLEPGTQLSVHLKDIDLQFNDDVGSFSIGYDLLVTALQRQQLIQVQVDEATHGQVLFAGISVAPAG